MGCGISKLDLEGTREGSQIRTVRGRTDDKDYVITKNETGSLTSRTRRSSVSSMTSEGGSGGGGSVKRVMGSNEKERGVEKELELSDHDRKSTSCFKQPQVETMEKDSPNDNKSHDNDNGEEYIRPSDVDVCGASILFSPGSPSFRVYCGNDILDPYEDDGEEEREENKSSTGTERGETLPAKRGRLGRGFRSAMNMGGPTRGLKSVLQRGGSHGMKNILNGSSCRTSNASSPSDESTTKLIAKAV